MKVGSRVLIMLALAAIAACVPDYEFRSEDRPAYDNTVSPEELVSLQQQGATVLDVRLLEDFDDDPVLIPDSRYRNPDDIQSWTGDMSPSRLYWSSASETVRPRPDAAHPICVSRI